ncbi:hypothetical protein G9F72_005410 [Clostridium estertheticum]|uniref:hypothetical protein n=1 Tax=Clostridium estertheticum TaxID=238834 RepID=UPI0013E972D6|nr:hypothetical protein [Clostridium estertheticum]MBZ9685782.1 hypothetical protein [Clostridium estertheticum]
MLIFTLILLGVSMTMGIYSIIYPKKVFGFQVFWNLRRDANPIEREGAIDFIRIKAIIGVIITIILLLAVLTQY